MTHTSRNQDSRKAKSKDENTKRPKDGSKSSPKGTSSKTNKAPKDHRHQDFVSYPRSEAGSYSSSPADDGRSYVEEYYGKQKYAWEHEGVPQGQPRYTSDFKQQIDAVQGLGSGSQYTMYYDNELVLDDTEDRGQPQLH